MPNFIVSLLTADVPPTQLLNGSLSHPYIICYNYNERRVHSCWSWYDKCNLRRSELLLNVVYTLISCFQGSCYFDFYTRCWSFLFGIYLVSNYDSPGVVCRIIILWGTEQSVAVLRKFTLICSSPNPITLIIIINFKLHFLNCILSSFEFI